MNPSPLSDDTLNHLSEYLVDFEPTTLDLIDFTDFQDLTSVNLDERALTLFDPAASIPKPLEKPQTTEEASVIDNLVRLDNQFLIQFDQNHMEKLIGCVKTGQRFPNEVILTNAREHANKMIRFITALEQFKNISLKDQFNLLPKINKQLGFLTYAFYATPMKSTTNWERKIQMETNQDVTKITFMTLMQILPPKEWYTSQDHQEKVTDLVQKMTLLSLDQRTFILTYLMAFFQGLGSQDSQSVSKAQGFFRQLLYSHLSSKMGKVFVEPVMQRHLKAVSDMEYVDEILFPNRIPDGMM